MFPNVFFFKLFNNLTNNLKNSTRCLSWTRIIDINSKELVGKLAVIKGWVSSVRKMKEYSFVDVNDGSCVRKLQVIISKVMLPPKLSFGCSVKVSGVINVTSKEQFELLATDIEVLGECNFGDGYPFEPRKNYAPEYLRQYLHFRPRNSEFSSLLRVRHKASLAIHQFFGENGFFFIHTPVLTSNDCEGAGEIFKVIPESMKLIDNMEKINLPQDETFFGNKTFLTVSGQLHLEVMARSLGQVYNFSPTFRAENSKSRLHLSEFYMVEAETSFISSLDSIISLCEHFIRNVTVDIITECYEEVQQCRKSHSSNTENYKKLEDMVASPFKIITYSEVCDILSKHRKKLKTQFKNGSSLTKEQELFLVKYNNDNPLFVVDWPKLIKPFYMKTSPTEIDKVKGFDLLCPNVGEICGGSLREDNLEQLKASLIQSNMKENLKWYLQLREFGNVLTGGFGLGFERYLQVLLHITNIKDTIPFPRWPHNCKL